MGTFPFLLIVKFQPIFKYSSDLSFFSAFVPWSAKHFFFTRVRLHSLVTCNILGLISHLKPLSWFNTTAPMLLVNQKMRGNHFSPNSDDCPASTPSYSFIIRMLPVVTSQNTFFWLIRLFFSTWYPQLLLVLLTLFGLSLFGCARPASAVIGGT